MSKENITADDKVPSFQTMQDKLTSKDQKNLSGSIEQCKEELRDAYMNFKDLQMRCVLDLSGEQDFIDTDNFPVYYFRPDTFLLDKPAEQKQYRESLLRKISSIPKPDPIVYLGDELHRSMSQTVADRSNPKLTKNFLAKFFKRRQYSLQHMKYKLLCRWAHHNLTSETIENISTEATFIYGKLEFNLEQAILRSERLEQEDFYDKLNRPSTKSEHGGSALYVENFDLQPQSLIREDDIEVYIRGVAHRNKINKLVNKWMSRLKWLPLHSKYDIFENAITDYFNIKSQNLERQKKMVERVENKARSNKKLTAENEAELQQVLSGYHCSQFEKMFLFGNDRTKNFWKGNHDRVPKLISDSLYLKLRITDSALKYNLVGDIELDQGYSFSYQVTTFFPTYFQKQILKSQFSIYDIEDNPNVNRKHNLTNLCRVDTNIFRDLSFTKGSVPTDEAINVEIRSMDIKVMRIKTVANWIDYISLTPNEPDWHVKQQALLSFDNPVDTLLKSGFNFIDINDLASISQINEDNALLHKKNVQKFQDYDPNQQMKVKNMSTQDGDKTQLIDLMPYKMSQNYTANIQSHLLTAVQEQSDTSPGPKTNFQQKKSSYYNLPQHLLISYYTLRFMSSRDAKTRILYTLNYFRTIQKRLAIDLREFATRDKMDANYSNPFIQSREANQQVINQANFTASAFEKVSKPKLADNLYIRPTHNMTVFDEKAISEMKNMASFRLYKLNGYFNTKVMDTCPSYPKFHAAHGEPLVRQCQAEEYDRSQNYKSISEQSIKLMGRIEFVEINEQLKEVYIRDDFGIYIIHDCVFQDLKSLEDELIKLGSYYIHKSEILQDPTLNHRPVPSCDRLEMVDELLNKEADFQFHKVKLIQIYMECYEHITDPLNQQQLMQIITDLMSRRPRLNLNANYFIDAYDAEIICLQKQFEVLKMVVDMQISLEKTENKRLQDSLELSFHLANQYQQNRWQYQDAESLLRAMERTRQLKKVQTIKLNKQKTLIVDNQSETSLKSKKSVDLDAVDQQLINEESVEDDSVLNEEQFGNDVSNKFAQLLGLPQVTLESIYQSYREKDHNILKIMAEHSHFIAVHEGYPEFLTRLTHRSIIDKNRLFKPNSWSQETGSLDFYETLDFITKYYALTASMQQELYDSLKMWDTSLMTNIDIQVAELSLVELKKVICFLEGSAVEYEGRQYVEDEQILGNSDKMIFYAKEMISDLTLKPKHLINPFLIAKLDVETIKYYEFLKIPRSDNFYTNRNKSNIAGAEYLIQSEKHAIAGIAQSKAINTDYADVMADLLNGKVNEPIEIRNITVPSQLSVYCNMVELHRLRSEIILAASECSMLGQVYLKQSEFIGNKSLNLLQPEGISFDRTEFSQQNYVNFFDDGPAHNLNIDLAIKEFDQGLTSNLNFRNPDAFKLNILTAGLEEVRAILQYQILQKHLLIVATRLNSFLIDTFQRSYSELNLLQNKKIAIPNSNINYNKLLVGIYDSVNVMAVKDERQRLKQNMSTFSQPLFYNIIAKKNQTRTTISKDYSNFQIRVIQKMPNDDHCIQRIMRCFKLKLLSRFVQYTLIEVYLDAQKIQALQTSSRLRLFARYFMYDSKRLGMPDLPQLLKFESNQMMENIPINYSQDTNVQTDNKLNQKKSDDVKVINGYDIIDYNGIPSSSNLIQVDSSPIEDIRNVKQRRVEIRCELTGVKQDLEDFKEQDLSIANPEKQLQQILPTFSPYNYDEQDPKLSHEANEKVREQKLGKSGGQILDYYEGLYFGNSQYAAMTRYFVSLERILQIEWFINKLQLRSDEVIHLENAIESGTAFWKEDELDQLAFNETNPVTKPNQINIRAQQFFYDKVVSQRQKRNIAEVISSMGLTIQSFITQYQKTKPVHQFEYISQYTEFRYQQIVGSMHKLIQQYYYQNNELAVATLRKALAKITKMNHVKVVYLKPNNYSVSTSLLAPDQFTLDSGNFIYGSVQYDEVINFQRCVTPIVNEQALEPPQISLFQSMFSHDYLRKNFTTQFPGQLCSTAGSVPFLDLSGSLLSLTTQERVYCQSFIVQAKYQANDFMETVYNDTSMAKLTSEEVYNLNQLIDAKKFMNETTQALLLRNALICWFENSTLPESAKQYEEFEKNFRQNYFWKQLQQKELLTKKVSSKSSLGQIPTQTQINELSNRINELVNDHSLATEQEINKKDALIKLLREEFASLKKKVTLDNYFNTKAEIHVFSNEIEKFLIQASIKTLDSECAALAKCFTMQVPTIQYHIHPFQQFAATLYDKVDPQLHLDVSNKVTAIQTLLTKVRNRSTEVETLTSGPGLVITIKDFNDILIEFCKITIKDQEKQFKSRNETEFLIQENLRQLVYSKDQKIKTLERRLNNIGQNLENIVDTRFFEKGNQLIYELDSSNRILNIFKNAMYGLETSLIQKIHGEQLEKFKRKTNIVELKTQKFQQYKETILHMINADFAEDQERIKIILKQKADNAKNTDFDSKRVEMYQIAPENTVTNSLLQGAIVPIGFQHYSFCSCYKPDPRFPQPTKELAELEMLTEAEARRELLTLYTLIRKQRILYRSKEVCLVQKYQTKINQLTKQLSNNGFLWDQLADSEKREKVLKQELLYTQQQLTTSEKTINSLTENLRKVDTERIRLMNFKLSKVEVLKELEQRVKQMDLDQNIDTQKLVNTLYKQEHKLMDLEGKEAMLEQRIDNVEKRRDSDFIKLKRNLMKEQAKTISVVNKMEQIKLELKMIETNDASVGSIWKQKCIDMFEVCQQMKIENDELRARCQELINQGMQLAETVSMQQSEHPTLTPGSKSIQKLFDNRAAIVTTAATAARPFFSRPQPNLSSQKKIRNQSEVGVYHRDIGRFQSNTRERIQDQVNQRSIGKYQHNNDIKSILQGGGDIQRRKLSTTIKPNQNEFRTRKHSNAFETKYDVNQSSAKLQHKHAQHIFDFDLKSKELNKPQMDDSRDTNRQGSMFSQRLQQVDTVIPIDGFSYKISGYDQNQSKGDRQESQSGVSEQISQQN